MAHYFSRAEAEALLPQITLVLRRIQESRRTMLHAQSELESLRMQAAGNGHHLHERMLQLQQEVAAPAAELRKLAEQLDTFGCVLKDPDKGLIDFLSLRDDREVYLCWFLGEERINYWHDILVGFAGRRPL